MEQRIIEVVKAGSGERKTIQVEKKTAADGIITGIGAAGANVLGHLVTPAAGVAGVTWAQEENAQTSGRILAAEGKSQNQILREIRRQKLELQKNGYDLTRKKIGARL